VINHIDKMKALVDLQTRIKLIKLAGYLDYYRSSLDDSWSVRNISRIQSDLRAFDRYLRDNLRTDKLEGHFLKSVQLDLKEK
ncbi:MAG: hypothetical protein HQL13_08900, partial [Candidatus Omnitrophica bacterium]|nr:hypothetical protein [Candidatus Omnitrophota bacterium]